MGISKLETQMNNFMAANGGYVTTDNLSVLSGFREKIAALKNTLNQPEAEKETGKYATLGEAYVDSLENEPLGQGFTDDVVNREQEIAQRSTKPFVPTMTEPIPEYSQPEKPSIPEMTEPIQRYGQPELMVPTMTEPTVSYTHLRAHET